MKKIINSVLFLVVMSLSIGANAYWCSANSTSAYGYGFSPISTTDACERAVTECVVRTPHWQVCYVTKYGL
jgi:hypothetical protein